MITAQVNGRALSVWFCYKKSYALDIPRKLTHAQRKGTACYSCGQTKDAPVHRTNGDGHLFGKAKPEARFERVLRPLTQCYLGEGTGPDRRIVEKVELKLYHRDLPYDRKSDQMERLRMFLMEAVMRKSGLTKDERRCLWHSFLTRRTVRPNIATPDGTPPAASVATPRVGRRINVVSTPDTVPEGNRIVVARRASRSPDGHGVTNQVVTPFPNRWHYDRVMALPLEPGEMVH